MFLITVAIVTMCVGLVYGQTSKCFTPDGVSGECIDIFQCEPILTLANKPMKTNRDLTLLLKSDCGVVEGVQKVCCPELKHAVSIRRSCNTPDGRPGTCVGVNSCPHIANMLRPPVTEEIIDFVKKLRCNSPEPYTVCCEFLPEEVQSNASKVDSEIFETSKCFTPDGVSGECIDIFQCEPILTLANKPMKTNRDLTLLLKSDCGVVEGMQKVCCPESELAVSISRSCNTPDGRPGTCIGVNSCPHIANMLRPPVTEEVIDFVKKLRCNSPEPYTVCCEFPPEEVQTSDYQTKMSALPPHRSSECCGESNAYKVDETSKCFTPDGVSGECIDIFQCEPILTLANKPMKTNRDLTLLLKSDCGVVEGVQKVCCPESELAVSNRRSCNTPDGRPGTCVGVNSCPHIANMLRPPVTEEIIDFVKKLRCNSPEPYSVCCEFPPEEVHTSDCQTKMTAFPPNRSSECCGEYAYNIDYKIFGGNATAIDEHPWTVLIEYSRRKDGGTALSCGGALISGKYVLTAAHCIAGPILETKTPKRVRLGEYDITNEGMDCVAAPARRQVCTDGVIRIAIARTTPHPMYNPEESKRYDIGLIRLQETAPYTEFIRPVCLPTKDLTRPENTPPHFSMYAVGWGQTLTRTYSPVKQHVIVPFVSLEKCQPKYNKTGRNIILLRSQFCAGGVEHKDTCKGDSGGPLVYENQYKYELIGIVNFGPTQCGQKGVPAIYSNVYEYLDWIKSVIINQEH